MCFLKYIYVFFIKSSSTKTSTENCFFLSKNCFFIREAAATNKSSSPGNHQKGPGGLLAIQQCLCRWEFIHNKGHVTDPQGHQCFDGWHTP